MTFFEYEGYSPWIIQANIISSSSDSILILGQKESFVKPDGTVLFQSLGVSEIVSNLTFEFSLLLPFGINR